MRDESLSASPAPSGQPGIRINGQPATADDVIAIGRAMDAEDGEYPAPSGQGVSGEVRKPDAWMRRYVYEGTGPGTRNSRPPGFKFHDVTAAKVCPDDVPLYAAPAPSCALGEVERLREALRWYAEQVADCRKITPAGDQARKLLDADGGVKARTALSPQGLDAKEGGE